MNDIVERLRTSASQAGYPKHYIYDEAADEIERLRTALRQIADGWAISMTNMQQIARAALKEDRHE